MNRVPHFWARHRTDERGSFAVEFAIIAPVMIMIVMVLIQWAVRLEAERAVNAAAREGAVAAARFDGTHTTGAQTARDYLTSLNPNITGTSISASRGTQTARVQVSGNVLMLVPGFDIRVSATAEQPVERFTP